MIIRTTLIASAVIFVLAGTNPAFCQDSGSSTSHLQAQKSEAQKPGSLNGQPGSGDDHTLEIAPQPGALPPGGSVEEVPNEKAYVPSENHANLNKNFNPNNNNSGDDEHPAAKRPSLGISVKYTTKCLLGGEENGLEVISVDPSSPAEKAGLKGSGGATPVGAAAMTTVAALLGPLAPFAAKGLQKSGQLGQDGDFIVAVDDVRVRSELDLEDELNRLKPGDTMYLTVLRPLASGAHQEMKIAVKVGQPATAPTQSARTYDDNGAEREAY